MADTITAQDQGTTFTPHDEGQFSAVCADVIDLGQRVEQFQGKPARIVHKCALVFLSDTPGATKDVAIELTVSMNERATLRAFLESWRGKSYTEEQAKAGVPLHKLAGMGALISVEHKKSAKGRTYAKLKTIMPLPKGMTPPAVNGYERATFWADRKKQYADEAAKWAATLAAASDTDVHQNDEGEVDEYGRPIPF